MAEELLTRKLDNALLIIILIMLMNYSATTILHMTVPGWYHGSYRYLNAFFNILGGFIPFVLGFIIRDKTTKIMGIIFGAIMAVAIIIGSITFMLRMASM